MTKIDESKYSKQPIYADNYEKYLQRLNCLIEMYRGYSGNYSIPKDRIYVTLSNIQPPDKNMSEINQIVTSGLINKNQFYGIDRDNGSDKQHPAGTITKLNSKWHPESSWFQGEWFDVWRKHYKDLNSAALIFYDSIQTPLVDGPYRDLKSVMMRCENSKTLIVANLCLDSAWVDWSGKCDSKQFLERLFKRLPSEEALLWECRHEYYEYQSSKTVMGTYFLWKEN